MCDSVRPCLLRFAFEILAQLGILGADAHGAGVQIADTHHHAALAHQQGGAKAEFLSAQHTADGHITAGEQLGIALNADAGAQAVHNQGLVGLGDAQLPGQARVLDGGTGCRAGAAVVAGDQKHEEIDLKNPKSNRGNAGFSDEERGKFTELLDAGFTDTWRAANPDVEGVYSWWSYRFNARKNNAGWRIDYFLVSDTIAGNVRDAGIRGDIFGSDHCPVTLALEL